MRTSRPSRPLLAALLAVALLLGSVGVHLSADHARTLPARVLRTHVIPIYSFAREDFKDDFRFDIESASADVDIFSIGFALEYGITDWITAAAQWTPTAVLWSKVDADLPWPGDPRVGTWFDLFLGAKVQVVGERAPVRSDRIRFALAPGVKIPTSGEIDWDDELASATKGDDFILTAPDRNILGFGGRFFLDYIVSPSFFINFYGEAIYYPGTGNAPSLPVHARAAGWGLDTDDFSYGYDITLEVEPHYIHTASPGLQITGSLPVTYEFAPEVRHDGTRLSKVENSDGTKPFAALDPGRSSRLSVEPTVEFFFRGLTVPTALEVSYRRSIAGENANVLNAVVIKIKNYLRI
ncbi:hypothetical protein AU468_09040 [Alkalispirochaeta sphaeroplastigenens]|uniref:Uncharacterized protein n=1 Tax=Alkalispirochaeta sphaeroplastigenens TaxID=1187066 RepID=A0A2S4JNB2_9SPIO|nr:hypothetical protein [Alkalispirochaeta sphaeroplastigenens]POR01001.1 hypothetical protein AU468_09040 [Alkalispirochaeta sphaeroplastigenens]